MKKAIISLLAAALLFGCANPGDVPIIGGKLPGKFSATVLSDAIGQSARGVSLGTYTVANSRSIYFILRNVGDFPITNVTLTPGKLNEGGGAFVPITDGGITASPGTIAVLETSGNATVETVIEVDVNHGDVIGLISQQYIQKANFAGATLRITGKTRNEAGAALDISLDADIETLIKVASFELQYSLNNGVSYMKAKFDMDYKQYIIPYSGKDYIKILNTGNVPLRYNSIKYLDFYGLYEYSQTWKTIEAGEYSNAFLFDYDDTAPNPTGGNNKHYNSLGHFFLIDTIGVAFDNDGNEYFAFRPNTSIVINLGEPDNNIRLSLDIDK